MSCWMLWQRMPPRYQLTMRDIRTDDDHQDSTPQQSTTSPRTSTTPTPRVCHTPRGMCRHQRHAQGSAGRRRRRLSGDAGAMLRSSSLPGDEEAGEGSGVWGGGGGGYHLADAELSLAVQNPVLPPRSSAYVHNMKNQMRINSAKRKIDEGAVVVTSPTTLSYSPKPRATTAPAFPITDPSNTDEYHRLTAGGSRSVAALLAPYPGGGAQRRGFSGRKTLQRPSSTCYTAATASGGGGVGMERRRVSVPVSTLCPFQQTPEFRGTAERPASSSSVYSRHRRSSPTHQDCIIGDYQVAALYVDKGRVTFFRRTKPDVTQSVYSAISPYNVSREDGSYLSHLRKAYLSGVRDLPKVTRKDPDLEKHSTIRERMDYDRKVGRILDYYTKVDVPKVAHTPRPPSHLHQSTPFPAAQHAFKTFGYRRRPPRASAASSEVRDSALHAMGAQSSPAPEASGAFTTTSGTQDQHPVPAPDSGDFVTINAKAHLHDRHHFYLRTPANRCRLPGKDVQDSDCACGMCRLEMEVALMAQLHQDLGVSVDAVTAAHIRSSLEKDAIDMTHGHTLQAGMEADSCPARPNSVSDTRRYAASSEFAGSSKQGAEPTKPAGQHPESSREMSTSTQTPPVVEPTSLTVTLPVIEEATDGTHVVQESEVAEPKTNDNTKATEKTDQTMPAKISEQEASDNLSIEVSANNSEHETSESVFVEECAKNPEEETSDTVTVPEPVNPEQEPSDATTSTESVKNSDQEMSDTVTGEESVMKSTQETPESVIAEEPLVASQQGISDTVIVEENVKTSEQEMSDSVTVEESVKNSEQEIPDIVSIKDSTVTEEPNCNDENGHGWETDSTDLVNNTSQSNDDNDPLQPSVRRHSDDSNTDDGVKGNAKREPDTSLAHSEPAEDRSLQENSTFCDHGGDTFTESEANVSVKNNARENTRSADTEDQTPPDDLPSNSNVKAICEGNPPTPLQQPGNLVTVETAPEEVGDVRGGGDDSALAVAPPTIVISLASDNEETS